MFLKVTWNSPEGPMIRASFFDACFNNQANIHTTMRLGPRRHTGFHLVPVTITNIPHDRKPFYMACPHEVADVTGMQKMQDVTGKNRSFHHDGISLKWSWCHFSVPYVFLTLPMKWAIGCFSWVSRSQFQILRAEVKMAQNQRFLMKIVS